MTNNPFELSSEQQMLRDSVQRYVSDQFSFEQWRAKVAGHPGFDRDVWASMADMGWLGVGISQEAGGIGANIGDCLIVMEGMGRGLILSPYLGSVVMAGQILDRSTQPAAQDLLQAIIAGEKTVSVAHAEPGRPICTDALSVTARRVGAGFVLSGRKDQVLNANCADAYIVSAAQEDNEGKTALFLVPAGASGLHRQDFRAPDKHSFSDLEFKHVAVDESALLQFEASAQDVLARALDYAIVASLAEALGCMSVLREMTLEYLKTRKQFGVLIGTFQVLRHRMVDIAVACEEARSLLLYVASRVNDVPQERARAVSAAKVRISQLGTFVAKQAIQIHGAIGVTDELAVSHHFKRLMMIFSSYGSADHHLRRFSRARA